MQKSLSSSEFKLMGEQDDTKGTLLGEALLLQTNNQPMWNQ